MSKTREAAKEVSSDNMPYRGGWPLPYNLSVKRIVTARKGLGRLHGRKEVIVSGAPDEVKETVREASDSAHTDSVRFYFNSIRKIPLLTAVEETALSRRVAKGDQTARGRMIEANLRLVVNMAKRYLNRGLPLTDLIEEGNIGLIKAVERFKASKGCRFSTYATYWIRQSVERAITNQSGIVRLPIHVANDLLKISRAARELTRTLNREPSISELSGKTGLSGRYVKKLDNVGKKSYSLDASINGDPEQTQLSMLTDADAKGPVEIVGDEKRSCMIRQWLGMLDENEKRIITLRFGLDDDGPATLEVIGESFGVTRERVRQIEVKALGKLRRFMESSNILSLDAI